MTARFQPTQKNRDSQHAKHQGMDLVGRQETVTLNIPTHTQYKYEIKTLVVPLEMLIEANIAWPEGDRSVKDHIFERFALGETVKKP